MEFKKGYQLVYGEWKITEFLGGGMPGYSMGISSEGQKNLIEQNETIKIHPDYVIVDGKKVIGDIHILYKMIPKMWIYTFITPWIFEGNAETELKCKNQDFYLLATINFDGDNKVSNILLENNVYVKDKNTLIVATIAGFYKIERVSNLSEDEIENVSNNISSKYKQEYLDASTWYKYELGRYRLVYGEWRIERYIETERKRNDAKTIEIGTCIDFNQIIWQ